MRAEDVWGLEEKAYLVLQAATVEALGRSETDDEASKALGPRRVSCYSRVVRA
jgi:hypothetical protein